MGQTAREPGAVVIDGVPKLSWSTNTQCCFVGALSAALAGSDNPVDERELNGLTALAFRTRWLYYEDKPAWCPSCPVGECHEEFDAVARNVGWKLDSSFDWPIDERRQKIVESIDAGLPVLVYDTQWNSAVGYGYAEVGNQVVVTDYFGGDGAHELKKLPPYLVVIQKFTKAPDRKIAVIDALQMAVANWHCDHKHNGAAVYWYGKAAYDHWIHDVLESQDEGNGNPVFTTWWNMDVLVEARQQASLWLADVAPLFSGAAEEHLLAASAIYGKEHELLRPTLLDDAVFDADPKKWKEPEHRQRIADFLTQARDLEMQAVAEIEKAE